ncbi:hypothetical protein CPC08DRAFT_319106 [Agrocybe pediades]|nr:hypothetical protein CPC08DRAFT_319106 [Agrocybe pediades]
MDHNNPFSNLHDNPWNPQSNFYPSFDSNMVEQGTPPTYHSRGVFSSRTRAPTAHPSVFPISVSQPGNLNDSRYGSVLDRHPPPHMAHPRSHGPSPEQQLRFQQPQHNFAPPTIAMPLPRQPTAAMPTVHQLRSSASSRSATPQATLPSAISSIKLPAVTHIPVLTSKHDFSAWDLAVIQTLRCYELRGHIIDPDEPYDKSDPFAQPEPFPVTGQLFITFMAKDLRLCL